MGFPYGPSCRPKRAVSRGAGACFVEHGASASKQGGCGRGSVGAARHGPVAGIGETNMKNRSLSTEFAGWKDNLAIFYVYLR